MNGVKKTDVVMKLIFYGPHSRPDMAPYKFMKAIMNETPIDKYGDGTSSRDYTYVDDIVSGIIGALENRKEKLTD